ncbi:hypothetical protein [Novosphingobium pentaromativorans]|uniref:Uncharacterized protein n=1 Tax=Novosphingobium pentaromativorans US6-1 TaxID=1088721 RepID=G6E7L1_9SPHN|nr:hypothetical protein [Novosphingobium pentaromativorans]AIT81591.1 hypothetical protein JI59_18355 [Novosphingobium pentaromativorans US6-1]EHJ62834.1 hypothetical protein NSU_0346 [Novosphingobium pentaromativorans US6-1]
MFIWPAHLFKPKIVNARPVSQTISGGASLSGVEDVIATDGGGRWIIEFSGINLTTPAQQRAWSAWAGYLDGGATECLVPILSLPTGPRPFAWDKAVRVSKLVTDNDVFPTSAAYSVSHMSASIGANAALRATSLQINLTSQGEIVGGEKFSIGDYAYRIVRETSAGIFSIRPPLREAVTAGAAVNFDWPVVRCRMQPAQDFESPINFGRFSESSITFIESVPVGVS